MHLFFNSPTLSRVSDNFSKISLSSWIPSTSSLRSLCTRSIESIGSTLKELSAKVHYIVFSILNFFRKSSPIPSTQENISTTTSIEVTLPESNLSRIQLTSGEWDFVKTATQILAEDSAWTANGKAAALTQKYNANSHFHPLKALIEASLNQDLRPRVKTILDSKGTWSSWRWNKLCEKFQVQLATFKESIFREHLLDDAADAFLLDKDTLYSLASNGHWESFIEYFIKGIFTYLESTHNTGSTN